MIEPDTEAGNAGFRSLWLFCLTVLPDGVGANFLQSTAPFLLSKAGVPVHTIATITAIAWCPLVLSFVWAPLVDLGWRRRNVVVVSGFRTAALLSAAIRIAGARHVVLFGALATLVPVERRGRAGRGTW